MEDPSSAKYNEDVTTRLYLSQKYTFEKTEGSKDGDKIMAQIQNYLGDTSTSKILNKFKGEGVYLSTFKIVPIGDFYSSVNLYAMTALPNSVIKSAEKDPNGRINLKSAPDVIVFSIEYQNVETEKAWLKTCPVAVTKTSGENGSAQLCPGEDGSFAADQTVKIGVNAELTTDEKDILAFADNAKSIEELCVINCSDVNGEFDSEKKECRCKKGYTWNAGSYECVEEKDDTDTTPDEDSDTIPEPSDDDADTVPEQNDDDADTGVVEPTEAEKCAAVGGTWAADQNKCIKNCDGKPENTEWNGSETYASTYSGGGVWSYVETVHSDEPGECHYKCAANYFWYSETCVNPCEERLFEEKPDGTYVYTPCNKWFADEHTDGSCTPTGATTYICGCEEAYAWNSESNTCDLTPCTIDDSFAASDYDEHFLFTGNAPLNDANNPNSMASIDSIALDLAGDDHDFEGSSNVAGYASVIDGSLQVVAQKTLNNTDFLIVSSFIPAENLNSAAVSANGKMNLDALRTMAQTLNLLYSGEETVIKSCYFGVSQFTGIGFTTGTGRVQICLGENRNFEVGEELKIGIDAKLNSDPDYVAGIINASGTAVCTFTCMYAHAEVKDAESGRCGCMDGYVWEENHGCVVDTNPCDPNPCGEHSICTMVGDEGFTCGCVDGYTWDGEKCMNNCSASSDFPCLAPETSLIWSSKATGITGENIVSHCDNLYEGNFNHWQAPTISQLRTLVVNCPTLEPDGDCGVTDSCLESTCWNGDNCACSEASDNKLGDSRLLSSSSNDNGVYYAIWHGGFYGAGCTLIAWPSDGIDEVRCTRCANSTAWNGTKCVQ